MSIAADHRFQVGSERPKSKFGQKLQDDPELREMCEKFAEMIRNANGPYAKAVEMSDRATVDPRSIYINTRA